MITLSPEEGWRQHILPVLNTADWIDDSKDISVDLAISKRELLTLIILAHIINSFDDCFNCMVGYDSEASEPNDGFLICNNKRLDIEHKFVSEPWTKQIALDAILSTYRKYAKKGLSYGENRTLVIHANKGTNGLIKVTKLRDYIKDKGNCPFDNVLLLYAVKSDAQNVTFHLTEHYPDKGLAGVVVNLSSGEARVNSCNLKTLPSIFC